MATRSRSSAPSPESPEQLSGRFYATLAGLSDGSEPNKQYRRQVMAHLHALSARIRSRSKASSGHSGYHASVNFIVTLLYRANRQHTVKAREIQRGLGYTAGGMTRRLDAMVRDGLLVRIPDPDDGRAWLAALTPKGVAFAESMLSKADAASKRLESVFTLEEWETLRDLLARLDAEIE